MAITPSNAAPVDQEPTRPPGVLPKHAQTWVVGGIAVTMIVILALTGNPPAKPASASGEAPAIAVVTDPSQARIHDYQTRIDEQTRKLAEEQARLAHATHALTTAASNGARDRIVEPVYQPAPATAADSEPQRRAREEADRNARSLFASNIAVSYRPTAPSDTSRSVAAAPAPSASSASTVPATSVSPPAASVAQPASTATASTERRVDPSATDGGPRYRLFEGTVIEAVLTNRLTSAFAGPVNGLVTVPVYASDRDHLVIPQGSRVLGEVKRVDAVGQERLAVTFHRVIRPDGSAVSLDQFHGLNQIGETGLRDQIDHHYVQIFGLSTAIGALAGLAQYHTRYSAIDTTANDAYRQGVSSSLAQSSTHILDRYLNVVPTFTIREGHRISVYLSQDLWLPPYPLATARIDAKE
jgi:type IV secretion system protein TrbI